MNPIDYPTTNTMLCIDLVSTVDNLVRFVTATDSSGNVITPSLAGKSSGEDSLISQFCPSGTDVYLGNTGVGDIYFSVF